MIRRFQSTIPHMSRASTRIHGLDTLRALAVTLVVLHHYVLFVSGAGQLRLGRRDRLGRRRPVLRPVRLPDRQPDLPGPASAGRLVAASVSTRAACCARCRISTSCWRCMHCGRPSAAGMPMLPLWQYLSFTQNIGLEPGTRLFARLVAVHRGAVLHAAASLRAIGGGAGPVRRRPALGMDRGGPGIRGGDGVPRRCLAARAGRSELAALLL
jgi:hypothetical protein